MKIINGNFNEAIIYTDTLEDVASKQIQALCDQEFVKHSKIRIMPDVHAGAGCTIGTTMTIHDCVVPNLVGVDIGCGMETIKIKNKNIELQKLDKLIYEKIPSGYNIRENLHKVNDEIDLSELRCKVDAKINVDRATKSLGTLGGGNHFIEANKDSNGVIYLVVHSGSRHLGLEVAGYYQNLAFQSLNGNTKDDIDNLIRDYKEAGRDKEIQKAIDNLKNEIKTDVPKELAYLTGTYMEDYIHDMKIVQRFAMLNRKAMMDEIIKGMKLKVEEEFTTIHNYIDTENRILRKGAVSARLNEKLIIPINMRDGSLICIGKGNDDWNQSAPHGAGRLLSRTVAKNTFTVSEFKKQMKDIYTTSVNAETLDECPMAYKNMDDIIKNIGPTADILDVIKPIYNFKAGQE
ncbi:MAG: hypothetical protein K0S41_2286 [Anaerocolumna sp.]|jgi:RNA-splicing ligase RtcB|nr:hypothetical protein [Anaerocolumna sp.]